MKAWLLLIGVVLVAGCIESITDKYADLYGIKDGEGGDGDGDSVSSSCGTSGELVRLARNPFPNIDFKDIYDDYSPTMTEMKEYGETIYIYKVPVEPSCTCQTQVGPNIWTPEKDGFGRPPYHLIVNAETCQAQRDSLYTLLERMNADQWCNC